MLVYFTHQSVGECPSRPMNVQSFREQRSKVQKQLHMGTTFFVEGVIIFSPVYTGQKCLQVMFFAVVA